MIEPSSPPPILWRSHQPINRSNARSAQTIELGWMTRLSFTLQALKIRCMISARYALWCDSCLVLVILLIKFARTKSAATLSLSSHWKKGVKENEFVKQNILMKTCFLLFSHGKEKNGTMSSQIWSGCYCGRSEDEIDEGTLLHCDGRMNLHSN